MMDEKTARGLFEPYLKQHTGGDNSPERVIYEAMDYSLLAGGKRLRPVLLLMACGMYEEDVSPALPFALAVELIHTYSLVHDDLPCMDDDDLRRGRPTLHRAFSEDIAVLAGDALLTRAFEKMSAAALSLPDSRRGLRAIAVLAEAAGAGGMIGGQVIDMLCETQPANETLLLRMYEKKTAALLRAPLQMGAILGGSEEREVSALDAFGKALGIAFQIQDDILDETSTPEQLGKSVKSDVKNAKATYVALYGLEKSRRAAQEYTEKALSCLDELGPRAEALRDLARSLTGRQS